MTQTTQYKTVRLAPGEPGDYTLVVGGKCWGSIHVRVGHDLPLWHQKAELYLFARENDPGSSYIAAEHVSPAAVEDLLAFVEAASETRSLSEIYAATTGRLGIRRSLSGLATLLDTKDRRAKPPL